MSRAPEDSAQPAGAASAPVILLGLAMPDTFRAQLATRYRLLGPLPLPLANHLDEMPEADRLAARALVTIGSVSVSGAVLDALPALGLVSFLGSGYEGIDLAAARERHIVVTHSPDANAAAVADLAVGLTIASVREFRAGERLLVSGQWQGNAGLRMPPRRGLTGRKLGIYGLGAVGARIARRFEAFDVHVGYHSRRPRSDVAYPYFATLAELARWADVLMIAVRADASTRHSVNAAVLAELGSDGHVINIARGSVIDEAALIAALADGTIAGAGLDVYEHEPAVPQALLDLPNVFTTPHLGGATIEAQQAMYSMVEANLDAFFAGKPAVTPVPG
jgi:lactate dehydrogenase-like 2-hydroxyacid dehydrogenase